MQQTVDAYYRAVTDGSLSNLVPEAEFGRNGRNTLLLQATPRRPWTLAVGGYVTTSTNSMLYFSAVTTPWDTTHSTCRSRRGSDRHISPECSTPSSRCARTYPRILSLTGVLSKQKFYQDEVLFFESSNPMFTTEIDNFARVGYNWAIGRRMKGYASVAGGYISDSYYPGDVEDATASATGYSFVSACCVSASSQTASIIRCILRRA